MRKSTRTFTEVLLKVHKDTIIKALAENTIAVGYKTYLDSWAVVISWPLEGYDEPQDIELQRFYSEASARKVAKEARQMILDLYGDYPRDWRF